MDNTRRYKLIHMEIAIQIKQKNLFKCLKKKCDCLLLLNSTGLQHSLCLTICISSNPRFVYLRKTLLFTSFFKIKKRARYV